MATSTGLEALLGQDLGPRARYKLESLLGAGGMGAVFQAQDTALQCPVAVKVLKKDLGADPTFGERFHREATTVARLRHPHILRVQDFGEDEAHGVMYLAMDIVRGGSLKDLLRRETTSWSARRALGLARQVLPALDSAHQQGVVHRDLKPDNILLEESHNFADGYQAFLADFGIAKVAEAEGEALTQTGMAMGTPAYMAPEQVMGQPVDGRADLYAFAVILYEALTGKTPFHGPTPMSVAIQHVSGTLPPPRSLNPAISEAVEAVLLKALARDPKDRYQTGADLLAAFTAAAAGEEEETVAVDLAATLAMPMGPSGSSTPSAGTHTMANVQVAAEHVYQLLPKLDLAEARAQVENKRANLVTGAVESLWSRPKPEDVTVSAGALTYEPFWHVVVSSRLVYDRTRSYSVLVGGDEVKRVTVAGITAEVDPHGRGGPTFILEGVEHCEETPRLAETFDGDGTSKGVFAKFLELAHEEVPDAATFEPAGATVIQPRAHAAAVVRKVVGQIVRPVHAQVIHEERVEVEAANLYFRPVYTFELLWKSKNKRVDVDLDGLTGEIQTEGAGRLSLGGLSWPR